MVHIPTGILPTLPGANLVKSTLSLAAGASEVLDPGWYLFGGQGADVVIEVNSDGASTWTAVRAGAVTGYAWYYFDGTGMRVRNAGAGTETATLYKIGK